MQGSGEGVPLLEVVEGVGRGLAREDCALILYICFYFLNINRIIAFIANKRIKLSARKDSPQLRLRFRLL